MHLSIGFRRLFKLVSLISYLLFFNEAYADNPSSGINFIGTSHKITLLPNHKNLTRDEFAGYLDIPGSNAIDKKFFYWLVSSSTDAKKGPLILWINGGPGASSMYGFFGGIGPYYIDQTLQLVDNSYGFNTKYNLLVMDQPLGVGFSTVTQANYINNEEQTTQDLYESLQSFYKKYPGLRNLGLVIAGESYAGHYIPKLAKYIIQKNKQNNSQNKPHIYLQGIMLGDAWVNPIVQQEADGEYAYRHGLIDKEQLLEVNRLFAVCKAEYIKSGSPISVAANRACMKISDYIHQQAGIDLHNIAKQANVDEYPLMERYLNLPDVKTALHVASDYKFALFSQQVADSLEIGVQDSVAPIISYLLEKNLKILVYNGLNDGTDCNFIGTNRWLSLLNWQQFNNTPQQILYNASQSDAQKQVIGYIKSDHNLTQVKLLNAGHMVAEDQPENLLMVVDSWIQKSIN